MSLASPGLPSIAPCAALVPLLTGLAAALLDLLPLPDAAPRSLAPFLTVCVVYFWTVYRPDLLPPLAVFVVGLALDAAGGLPLGLTALCLLIARALLMPGQRFLLRQPFPVVWAGFLLVVLAVAGAALAAGVAVLGPCVPARARCCSRPALTFAVYPPIGWLLARLQRRLVAGAACSRRLTAPAASRAAPWCWAARRSPSSARWRRGSTICRCSAAPSTRCWPRTTAPTSAC